MCGICGGIVPDNIDLLLALTFGAGEALEHRGPDAIGVVFANLEKRLLVGDWHVARKEDQIGKGEFSPDEFMPPDFRENLHLLATNIEADAFWLQTKYSTNTTKQDVSQGALRRNAQPILLRYNPSQKVRGHKMPYAAGVANGENQTINLEQAIKIRSNNPADVDTRTLIEALHNKSIFGKDVWRAGEWLARNTLGSFSLGYTSGRNSVFMKDRFGFRPLCEGVIGDYENPGARIFISESNLFNHPKFDIDYVREIKPAQMVVTYPNMKLQDRILLPENEIVPTYCLFEDYYFKDFFSMDFTGTKSVQHIRRHLGSLLAEKYLTNEQRRDIKDGKGIVISFINSGNNYSQGFANNVGVNMWEALRKVQKSRYFLIRDGHKYSVDQTVVQGKDIYATDDSIVRGDSISEFYATLKKAGAEEVNVYIAWPPIFFGCHLGIDTPDEQKLLLHELVENGYLKFIPGRPLEYSISDINKIATDYVRENIKMKFGDELNPNDINIYFGTEEMMERAVPAAKYRCRGCTRGALPFDDVV